MRSWAIALMAVLVALAGCMDQGGGGTESQATKSSGPLYDNETLRGEVPVTTFQAGGSAFREGPEEFDVPSGTRTLTLDLSWTGSGEVKLRVYNRDSYACANEPEDCTLYWATTEDGEAILTLSQPDAGTYDISFFAESEASSGEYVLEVRREIWQP